MINQSKKLSGPNLSVALLFKNIKDAKEISLVFKKIGIHPYFYSDLKSFWAGILESSPSLCVVDVTMMSEKSLILKNHPLIKTEAVPISFFYTDKSAPLMFSTFDIFHLGLIKSASSYAGQIKSILKRFNKINSMVIKEHELSVDNKHLNKKVEKLIVNTQELREKKTFDELLTKTTQEILNLKKYETFEEALTLFIKNFDAIDNFAMMELSKNSQKLVSSECFSLKFKKIPTLWLGKTCEKGIEAFAQVLASQVVMELVDGPMVSLNIDGIKENPERMIFIKANDEEFIEQFDWVSLERNLTSLYNYFENKESNIKKHIGKMKNPFELMSFLDAFKFGKYPDGSIPKGFLDEDYMLVNVNLENLVDLALSATGKGRFYWKEFYQDFSIKLEAIINTYFETIPMSTTHIAILLERDEKLDHFEKIKSFVKTFAYWRYFEDADMILSRSMKPEVKLSAFSAFAYLELISGGLEELNTAKNDKRKTKLSNSERKYIVEVENRAGTQA